VIVNDRDKLPKEDVTIFTKEFEQIESKLPVYKVKKHDLNVDEDDPQAFVEFKKVGENEDRDSNSSGGSY